MKKLITVLAIMACTLSQAQIGTSPSKFHNGIATDNISAINDTLVTVKDEVKFENGFHFKQYGWNTKIISSARSNDSLYYIGNEEGADIYGIIFKDENTSNGDAVNSTEITGKEFVKLTAPEVEISSDSIRLYFNGKIAFIKGDNLSAPAPILQLPNQSGTFALLGDMVTDNSQIANGAGYITSYTETDPLFSASSAANITTNELTIWNTAYTWGDHATVGYALLSDVPTFNTELVNDSGYLSVETQDIIDVLAINNDTGGMKITGLPLPTNYDDAAIKGYVDAEISNNAPSGLEKITEGANSGWRLIGVDPNDYGDIGLNAVDLSYSFVGSNGAMGNNSFAVGYQTRAVGANAMAIGGGTAALGDGSATLGRNIASESAFETVIGYYDTDYTPVSATTFESSDRLYVIGNGTGGQTRSDAFTILKNGQTAIGIDNFEANSTGELLQVAGEVKSTQYKLSALNTAPASATDTGTTGEIRITATHIYVCIATDTWVRAALTTW